MEFLRKNRTFLSTFDVTFNRQYKNISLEFLGTFLCLKWIITKTQLLYFYGDQQEESYSGLEPTQNTRKRCGFCDKGKNGTLAKVIWSFFPLFSQRSDSVVFILLL